MKIRKMRKSLHVTLAVLMSETLKIPFFSSLFVCLFIRSFVRSFVRSFSSRCCYWEGWEGEGVN